MLTRIMRQKQREVFHRRLMRTNLKSKHRGRRRLKQLHLSVETVSVSTAVGSFGWAPQKFISRGSTSFVTFPS